MNSYAILSLLPAKGQGSDGTGKFLANILPYLSSHGVVLMQDGEYEGNTQRVKANIINVWKRKERNRFKHVPLLLEKLGITTLVINFEYRAFGGFWGLVDLLFLIFKVKLQGVRVIGLMHHSLLRFSQYVKIFSLDSTFVHGILYATVYYPLLYLFHFMLLLVLDRYLVLESFLSRALTRVMPPISAVRNVQVLSHPIYTYTGHHKTHKRFWNVLYFGHITRYKGIETLLDAWETFDYYVWPISPYLHVAGGRSSTANDYLYYDKMVAKMKGLKGKVQYYGYVSEEEKTQLFEKADVLILPYAALVATSGPFATAIGAKLPVLLSEELAPLLDNQDIVEIMQKVGLNKLDIVYGKTSADLVRMLITVAKDEALKRKLEVFMEKLCELRTPERFTKQFESILSR